MIRMMISGLLLLGTLLFTTCERKDMHNIALYGLAPKNAIYLYQIGISNGNAKGANDANANCYTMGLPYHSIIGASTTRAFRGFSIDNDIRLIVPTKYWQYPVFGISPALTVTMISSSWAGLWDGALENPINTSLGMPAGAYWWSGSAPDGGASSNTCDGWYNADPAQSGQVGAAGISETALTCDTGNYLVCVAY